MKLAVLLLCLGSFVAFSSAEESETNHFFQSPLISDLGKTTFPTKESGDILVDLRERKGGGLSADVRWRGPKGECLNGTHKWGTTFMVVPEKWAVCTRVLELWIFDGDSRLFVFTGAGKPNEIPIGDEIPRELWGWLKVPEHLIGHIESQRAAN